MNAVDEARDLKMNPLPPVIIVDPLTRVWELEGEIAKLEEQISDLQRQRAETLDYAVSRSIVEDNKCKLEIKTRRTRVLNVEKFREAFPEEYLAACDIEHRALQDQLKHVGEKLPITLIDKLVKKQTLEAAHGVVSVKEAVSYGVSLK